MHSDSWHFEMYISFQPWAMIRGFWWKVHSDPVTLSLWQVKLTWNETYVVFPFNILLWEGMIMKCRFPSKLEPQSQLYIYFNKYSHLNSLCTRAYEVELVMMFYENLTPDKNSETQFPQHNPSHKYCSNLKGTWIIQEIPNNKFREELLFQVLYFIKV